MSDAVVSTSVIGSAAMMIQAGGVRPAAIPRTCSRNVRALAKKSGASNRKIDAARQALRLRIAAHVVQPGQPGHPAEGRLVRPPGAAEHVADREGDRDRDAGQDAEQHHGDERGDRERELGAADVEQTHRGGDVGERERRGDHHRGKGGLGQVPQQPGQEQQHHGHRRCPDQTDDLGLRAVLLGDGGPGSAGADGEALEETGRQVGRADPDHLLVAVDLLTGAPCERGRRGDGVRQRHQRDPEGAEDQRPEIGERPRAARSAAGNPAAAPRPGRRRGRPDGRRSRRGSRGPPPPEPRGCGAANAAGRGSGAGRTFRPPARPGPCRRSRRRCTKPLSSAMNPSPSTENPNSFGSWPTRMVSASPFM